MVNFEEVCQGYGKCVFKDLPNFPYNRSTSGFRDTGPLVSGVMIESRYGPPPMDSITPSFKKGISAQGTVGGPASKTQVLSGGEVGLRRNPNPRFGGPTHILRDLPPGLHILARDKRPALFRFGPSYVGFGSPNYQAERL